MNTQAKQQYMATLRERYFRGSKKEKGAILDEYCRNTGEDRKHAIKKFRYTIKPKKSGERKRRGETYDGPVKAALAAVWDIFDRPCGKRLAPLLATEVVRLRTLGELSCSDETVAKLRRITPATIDRKLRHEKEVLLLGRKHRGNRDFLLSHAVPVKTAGEVPRDVPGFIQLDCVEHCVCSTAGEYVLSLSAVDACSGWWEGDAVLGKAYGRSLAALQDMRERMPLAWSELHPDNGSNILNWHVQRFTTAEGIRLSRSRPYRKNDNCLVEQKNHTHVRKVVGYLRHDTEQERELIASLYRSELRRYKNFFQPVMKLVAKERVGGRIVKRYDEPATPYARLMASSVLSAEAKAALREEYERLNPAELKRRIEERRAALVRMYEKKNGAQKVAASRRLTPTMVSSYLMQPD
jgi:hypothetical protein